MAEITNCETINVKLEIEMSYHKISYGILFCSTRVPQQYPAGDVNKLTLVSGSLKLVGPRSKEWKFRAQSLKWSSEETLSLLMARYNVVMVTVKPIQILTNNHLVS